MANDGVRNTKGPQEELLKLLAKSPWFCALPPTVQSEILPKLHRRRFEAGETLYHQGAEHVGLWGILQGSIHSIGTAGDGNRSLLSVIRSGDWTGFIGILDGRSSSFSVVAVEGVDAVYLPHKVARSIFMRDAARMQFIAIPVAAVLRLSFDYLLQSTSRRPLRMVAQRLLDLTGSIYRPGSAEPRSLNNCNQDDIAAAVKITRPTANRILKQLADKGLISLGYGKIEVRDISGLTALAHGKAKTAAKPPTGAARKATQFTQFSRDQREAVLRTDGWFCALADDVRAGLIDQMSVSLYEKGAIVFHQDEAAKGLYVFLSGQGQAIGSAPDGHKTLMALYHPGNWVGHTALIDGRPTTMTCRTSQASQIGFVASDQIRALFHCRPECAASLLAPMAVMLRVAYRHMIESYHAGPERIIAERLYGLASIIYATEKKPRAFVDNFNQSDLANATGLSRPTVNKVLQKMVERGIVNLGYGRISILKPDALLQMSRGH